jgi:protoporphyrinogen oxidase
MKARGITSDLNRRELLAAFLGLPLAAVACNSSLDIGLPDGKIVGASDSIGHRIRDGLSIVPSSDKWTSVSVAIVGGGIAGLAAAYRLEKAGVQDYVLLELESSPGGTSRSGESAVTAYPWGAHYLPAPMKENLPLVELLDEMGILEGKDETGEPIVAEQFLCRDPEERVFYRGRWYEGLYMRAGATNDDHAQLDRFNAEVNRWVALRDGRGRRAFAIPVATGSDDPDVTALDRLTMAEWMDRNGFTSRPLRWLVDYACRDDYGLTMDQASAWAGLFYFASRIKKPGQEAEPLMTWPEGNGRLVNYLYEKCKQKVRLGLAVYDIEPTQDGADVIALAGNGQDAAGFHAKRVVFAAPQFLASYVIRDFKERIPAHLAEFEYGAWMVANLFLKDRPIDRGFPLAWDNVLYESPALGYVVATHQRGLDHGRTVFTYYYPLCDSSPREARTRLLGTDRDQWAEIALADLSRAHPEIRRLTERLDVMRWGHAMIRPRPGFIWSEARRKAAAPYRSIHFANTDLSGIALFEEAYYHGRRAAEEVLAFLRS